MKRTLWDKKREKARHKLVEVAYRLFEEKGFEQTTVDEITELAEVSRSTFFRYFSSKDNVAMPYQKERIQRLDELIAAYRAESPPLLAVKRGLLDMARYFKSIRAELIKQRRIIDASPHLKIAQMEFDFQWERVITAHLMAAGKRGGYSEVEAKMLGGMIFGLIMAVLRDWYASDYTKDLVKLGETAFRLLETGAAGSDYSGSGKDDNER